MPSPTENLSNAIKEYSSRRYALCIKFAQYEIARNPDCPLALCLLGMAFMKTNNMAECIETFKQAKLRNPHLHSCLISLAIAAAIAGQIALAKTLLLNLSDSETQRPTGDREKMTDTESKLVSEACRHSLASAPDHELRHYSMLEELLSSDLHDNKISTSNQTRLIDEVSTHQAVKLNPASDQYKIAIASLLLNSAQFTTASEILDRIVSSPINGCIDQVIPSTIDPDAKNARVSDQHAMQINTFVPNTLHGA